MAEDEFRPGLLRQKFHPVRVFRTGQLLLEVAKAEAVVDALPEDSPGELLAVDGERGKARTGTFGGGGESGRTGADDGDVAGSVLNHKVSSFCDSTGRVPSRPPSRRLLPPFLVSSSIGMPVSRLRIFMIFAEQKPP